MVVPAFPIELPIPSLTPRDKNILISLWQDSNKVGFYTTIYNGTEWVVRNRKRPKGISTSATITVTALEKGAARRRHSLDIRTKGVSRRRHSNQKLLYLRGF